MPLIKSKSKFDKSTCSYEKEGMTCGAEILKGDDYLYDTDAKKGYCTKHSELNAKAQEPSKGGQNWKGGGAPLCRSPDEALQAIKIWHETIVPMILETAKKFIPDGASEPLKDQILVNVTRTYEEVFLGKFTPSQIAK